MARCLYIGDWHQTVEDLSEGAQLALYVRDLAESLRVSTIKLLGDQYHNHALVHVRVHDFWLGVFKLWVDAGFKVVILKGNHDGDPSDARRHALNAHKLQPGVTVVDTPKVIDGILHVPYMDREEEFLAACNMTAVDTVICHQEFEGCQFENGLYTSHGFQLDKVPQTRVISGHIHKPQQFGKVWYPGAPRWRTATDANTQRYLYLVDEGATSHLFAWWDEAFPTNVVCSEIQHVVLTPESPDLPPVSSKARILADLRGPRAFIAELKASLPAGIRVRTFPTDTQSISLKESEGISRSFDKYLRAFKTLHGTSADTLAKMAQERLTLT